MRRAHPRDPPRHDLASLGDEARKHANVLVVDVVDPLGAEAANLLAPEVLLFVGSDGLVSAGSRDIRFHLLDELVDLFFRRVRLHDKQLFVDHHSSSVFKPGARRLNFVMDFSTPSAIMEATASAAWATSSSVSFCCERLMG